MALTTLTKEERNKPLAGCLALSTYFPGNKPISNNEDGNKISTPVLQCHGEDDEMISLARGQLTADLLKTIVKEHTFRKFPYMGHECNEDELACIKEFIFKILD